MISDRITFLAERGVNYSDAMERFAGNEELFLRLLGMFLDDASMDELEAAMRSGEWEQAERRAHALKGLAGNLSLEKLHREASTISSALRAGNVSTAEQHLPAAREAYGKAREAAYAARVTWANESEPSRERRAD